MSALWSPEGLAAAAAAVFRSPLRFGEWDDGDGNQAEVAERGWFRSAGECARHLAFLTNAQVSTAHAFGGEWPVLQGERFLMAPALPLVLTSARAEGVDAVYSWCEDAVYREAAGLDEVFLTTGAGPESPGARFDLLWFGDCERFTVREGVLEVEDLFGRLAVPVDRETLQRLLVRGRRVDAGILDGLVLEPTEGSATITVHRAAALHPDDRWRDPELFLCARADVEATKRRKGHIAVQTVTGATAVFTCEDRREGWTVTLASGDYLMTGFSMNRRSETLSLTATLQRTVDPLSPGMRGRLVFDLQSDLVALAR